MTVEELLAEWEKDKIDHLHIERSAYEIPKLHHKYLNHLIHERFQLKKMETELRVLHTQKWEFLSQGPSEFSKSKGWELPAKGLILKTEIPYYLDADEDLNKLKLRVDWQREKVDALVEIIKQINARNYIITNIVNYRKFEAGQ